MSADLFQRLIKSAVFSTVRLLGHAFEPGPLKKQVIVELLPGEMVVPVFKPTM
jgi:hypothetical protein